MKASLAPTPDKAKFGRMLASMGAEHTVDEAAKRRVRAEVQARRRSLTHEDLAVARAGLTRRLIELVESSGARLVTCYASLPDEPGTAGFIEWAEDRGVAVLLPATRPGASMEWIRPGGGFISGPFGIPEPVGTPATPAELAGIDLMLIPACAIDRRGVRLGWGGGYFDRYLARLDPRPPIYAVVFDDDILPELPREPHDVPVDGAVTPSAIHRFRAG